MLKLSAETFVQYGTVNKFQCVAPCNMVGFTMKLCRTSVARQDSEIIERFNSTSATSLVVIKTRVSQSETATYAQVSTCFAGIW